MIDTKNATVSYDGFLLMYGSGQEEIHCMQIQIVQTKCNEFQLFSKLVFEFIRL